jgi:hypothetical protein
MNEHEEPRTGHERAERTAEVYGDLLPKPTLTDFLLARIAEDEAAALPAGITGDDPARAFASNAIRAERAERMTAVTLDMHCPTCHAEPGATCRAMTPPHHAPKPADTLHGQRRDLGKVEFRRRYGDMVLWNPARVLAECDAKRRIVERHRQSFDICAGDCAMQEVSPCPTIRALALPYADHPDYCKEWKP